MKWSGNVCCDNSVITATILYRLKLAAYCQLKASVQTTKYRSWMLLDHCLVHAWGLLKFRCRWLRSTGSTGIFTGHTESSISFHWMNPSAQFTWTHTQQTLLSYKQNRHYIRHWHMHQVLSRQTLMRAALLGFIPQWKYSEQNHLYNSQVIQEYVNLLHWCLYTIGQGRFTFLYFFNPS